MCESYLEEFEEALKMKMLLDATYLLKSTNDLLNFNINYNHLSYVDGEQLKTVTYEHFQHIAKEYDFQFQIGFLENEYNSIKWYHNDNRIFPINGVIKPLKEKSRKEPHQHCSSTMKY